MDVWGGIWVTWKHPKGSQALVRESPAWVTLELASQMDPMG